MHLEWVPIITLLAGFGATNPIEKRAACTTLLNTRGTNEAQGESAGFRTMNANILKQVPGVKIYNTVYPAAVNQISASGTVDIINHIKQTLAQNPSECFILEGYSQGAAATVNALPFLTGVNFNAVKGVFLIGNPEHKPGLTCNVDNKGGTTTRNAVGIEAAISLGVPANWVSKTSDICIFGDLVCDLLHPTAAGTAPHLQYPGDAPTQNLGTSFAVGKLRSG